jgi:sec-independent protein translocase protein TatB
MFDLFSWSHILILLAVALVVVGPKDLPKLMHMVGKWAGKARGMANEFKKSFDDMARQSELDELRKEIESLRNHEALADINPNIDISNPLAADAPAATVDIGPEPRAGEFHITDTAPPPGLSVSEPSRQ